MIEILRIIALGSTLVYVIVGLISFLVMLWMMKNNE